MKKDFLKYTSKPTHVAHKIFGKDYAAVHEIKPVLILNKQKSWIYCSRFE